MSRTRIMMLIGVLLLSLTLVGMSMAADSLPEKEDPPPVTLTDSSGGGIKTEAGSPSALWPGPDGYGYYGQTISFNWVEISATGNQVLLGDDEVQGPFLIGFEFLFYGNEYIEFYLSSNGFLSFESLGSSYLINQCPVPLADAPNHIIAMLWDDLDPGDTNDPIYYQTFSSCPIGSGPCLVVQYEDFCHYPGGVSCPVAGTWEAILYADTDDVLIQFQDAGDEAGSGSTTGIKGNNAAADHGLTYVCNATASLSDNLAVRFQAPNGLQLSPDSASEQACEKADATYTLTLGNYTGTDGTFALSYASSWPISGLAQVFVPNMASTNFDVSVHVPCGEFSNGASVTASGNGFSDTSLLTTITKFGGFKEWEEIAPINEPARTRSAGAVVNGKFYVLGGQTSEGRANTVEEFDPSTGSWTTQAGLMPIPASNICAGAIGEDIYIPGGFDVAQNYLTELQVYHTATDSWEIIATDPLPSAKLGAGCAVLDDKLYVFGGITTGAVYTKTTYVFDPAVPAGSRWSQLSDMTYARGYLGGVAVNDKVYAVGGSDGSYIDLAYVEAYDPADGFWHTVTSMNTPRAGAAAYVLYSHIFVCGGGWTSYLNSCEYYFTDNGYGGAWVNYKTMTTGRRTFAYASMEDGFYTAAGWNGTYMADAERLPFIDCPGCNPASIDISPASLLSSQSPDMITTRQLQVCNAGDYTLRWLMAEGSVANHVPEPRPAILPRQAIVSAEQSDRADAYEGMMTQVGEGLQGSAGNSGFGNPDAILWDNGPFVTYPDACSGMDVSRLQASLGMYTFGFGHQYASGNHLADEFVVPFPASWSIESITFFAYQTGAPSNPSPITGIYYQIWDGPPDNPASNIIFGDLVTNRMMSSVPVNAQRDYETDTCQNIRYIFATTASGGAILPSGTYWIEWTVDGTTDYSGPWAPPITLIGQTTTGNAMQYISANGAWQPVLDVGQQGFPFIIEASMTTPDVWWLSEYPSNGKLQGGACSVVDVNFSSFGMPFGTYNARLSTYSDDPVHPIVETPVTMIVHNYHRYLPLAQK